MPLQLSSWDDPSGFNTTWRWETGQDLANRGQLGRGTPGKVKIRDPLPQEMVGYNTNQQPTALQAGSMGAGSSMGGSGGSSGSGGGLNSSALFQQAAATADPWAPQRAQYTTALNQLMQGGTSAIAADPSFQSRMQAGQDALARSAAAKGFLGSGNVLQETVKYGQDLASQEYGTQFNRLAKLAGVDAGSPTASGNILAQMPGQNLQEQQTGFNQAVTAQKLPYELTALQQGSQIGAQQVATGDIEQQMLQQQLQANKAAQNRLSMVQNLSQYPKGFLA